VGQESCPRCGGPLRSGPKDQGIVSRYEDATVICVDCGEAEGLISLMQDGIDALHPIKGKRRWARWPVATRPSVSEPG
jgi:hypothetical protein